MRKRAIISVLSNQDSNEDDQVEVVTPGEFYKKEDYYCVEYDETEISGMEGTKTTFKISKEHFSLIREGTTNAKMDFKESDRNVTLYDTPYGTLELSIDTKKLKIDIDDNGGEVFINYDITVAGNSPQNTSLQINIKPKEVN